MTDKNQCWMGNFARENCADIMPARKYLLGFDDCVGNMAAQPVGDKDADFSFCCIFRFSSL